MARGKFRRFYRGTLGNFRYQVQESEKVSGIRVDGKPKVWIRHEAILPSAGAKACSQRLGTDGLLGQPKEALKGPTPISRDPTAHPHHDYDATDFSESFAAAPDSLISLIVMYAAPRQSMASCQSAKKISENHLSRLPKISTALTPADASSPTLRP